MLAPFCFLYVKALTVRNWKFEPQHLLHFAPAVLVYFLFSIVFFNDIKTKENLILDSYNNPDSSPSIFLIIAAVQILIYLLAVAKLLRYHNKKIKDYFSYQESVNLRWLKYFLLTNFILWMAFIISTYFNIQMLMDISNLLFTFAMYSIGYFGIKQPDIFFYEEILPVINNQKVPLSEGLSEKKKYASSSLTDELSQEYAARLIDLMHKEKLYLQGNLKLVDIAERVNVPQHHLSQVINGKLKKNFNDFVNEFRVEEFKERLLNEDYKNLRDQD